MADREVRILEVSDGTPMRGCCCLSGVGRAVRRDGSGCCASEVSDFVCVEMGASGLRRAGIEPGATFEEIRQTMTGIIYRILSRRHMKSEDATFGGKVAPFLILQIVSV